MGKTGRRAFRLPVALQRPRAGSADGCLHCLTPSSWVLLLGCCLLLLFLVFSHAPSLARPVRAVRYSPTSFSSIASMAASPTLLRSAATALGSAAAALPSRRRRVRDFCAWSRLPWDRPDALVRWSGQNFTRISYTAPALDGAFQLHIQGCDLSWVTQRAARQCLASLGHLVVVGDSVSRLLFMSLTHFLHSGAWAPLDSEHPPSDAPRAWTAPPGAPGDDASPLDLPHYLAATAARMHGTEICDCHIADYHTENRYYREAGVDATYICFFSHAHGLRLHSPQFLNATCATPPCAQAGCAVGGCSDQASPPADFLRLLDGADDLRLLVDLLRPDVLLVNAGHHRSLDTQEGAAEVVALARKMGEGEGLRAAQRQRWAAQAAPALLGTPRSYGLEAAWKATVARLEQQQQQQPAPAAQAGDARNFIWRTTTPRRDPDGVWAGVLDPSLTNYSGAPALGAAPAAPRGPWPTYESALLAAVKSAGGRGFDAFTLLWPLIMLASKKGSETIAAVFAHPSDTLHHAPGVNSQLNRALLTFLCEDFEGELD